MKSRGGNSSKSDRQRPTASSRKNKAKELASQSRKSSRVENDDPIDEGDNVEETIPEVDVDAFVVRRRSNVSGQKNKGKEIASQSRDEDEDATDEEDEGGEEVEEGGEEVEEGDEDVDIGEPSDNTLLKDYKHHVASEIWIGNERGIPTFRHHYGRYALSTGWDLSKEPKQVQTLVRGSGLGNLLDYPRQFLDKPLLSAFVERWYPETNTFHLPFGEMTITLDDVSRILGVSVVGKILRGSYKSRDRCLGWLKDGLGIATFISREEFSKNKSFSVDLNWIHENTIKVNDRSSDINMMKRARGYLFFLLGSTLLSDKTGTRVSVVYLESLLNFDVIPTYNWGSAALAFMYRQLGSCSRASVKQMAGFLPLLEIWILDHFWMRAIPNLDFKIGVEPTINRWISHTRHATHGNAELIGIREHLDQLGPESVVWHCFPHEYPLQPITWYSGCIICFDTVEAYHPERVLRQMGRIQGIPKEPIPTSNTKRAKNGRGYKVEFPALQRYGDDWESHILASSQQGVPVSYSFQCTDDYIDWYYLVSHPIVTNPINRTTGPLINPTQHFNAQQGRITKALDMCDLNADVKDIQAILRRERRSKRANDRD